MVMDSIVLLSSRSASRMPGPPIPGRSFFHDSPPGAPVAFLLVALAAAAHPLTDTLPYDEICQERTLAVQVLKQAAEDLHFPAWREEAREFLLERFWTSWWHDLLPSLSRTAVILYTRTVLAQPARRVDADLKAPASTRAVRQIVKTWRTPRGNTRQMITLECGHITSMYAGPPRVACRACLTTQASGASSDRSN
jgi:hypothetical protein